MVRPRVRRLVCPTDGCRHAFREQVRGTGAIPAPHRPFKQVGQSRGQEVGGRGRSLCWQILAVSLSHSPARPCSPSRCPPGNGPVRCRQLRSTPAAPLPRRDDRRRDTRTYRRTTRPHRRHSASVTARAPPTRGRAPRRLAPPTPRPSATPCPTRYRPPIAGAALGMANAVITNDRITGQGSKTAAKCP